MKWEYLAIQAIPFEGDVALTKFLSVYGEERWELVHCHSDLFIFKRSKPLDIKVKSLFEGDIIEMRKAIEGYFGGKVG